MNPVSTGMTDAKRFISVGRKARENNSIVDATVSATVEPMRFGLRARFFLATLLKRRVTMRGAGISTPERGGHQRNDARIDYISG
ncbi:hypothetical protein [Methylobacterium sp. CM6247]